MLVAYSMLGPAAQRQRVHSARRQPVALSGFIDIQSFGVHKTLPGPLMAGQTPHLLLLLLRLIALVEAPAINFLGIKNWIFLLQGLESRMNPLLYLLFSFCQWRYRRYWTQKWVHAR